MNDFYVYAYFDQRKPEQSFFGDKEFMYRPFYVGKGRTKRIGWHLLPGSLKTKSIKNSIIKAIKNELDELPLNQIIFDGLSEEDAFDIEVKFIAHFGRLDNKTGILANHTDGRDGQSGCHLPHVKKRKPVYQYGLDGKFIRKWEWRQEAAKALGLHGSNISNSINRGGTFGNAIWFDEYQGEKVGPKIKSQMPIKYQSVKQIDMKTGEVVNTFASPRQAQEILGLNLSARSLIARCLDGRNASAYGFFWKP
jgi:hypothetical protein